jgi:hypothetical protein
MRITFIVAALASFVAAPTALRAQNEIGTWKLNAAKSKYTGVATPKSRTQTWESDGGGVKFGGSCHHFAVAGD